MNLLQVGGNLTLVSILQIISIYKNFRTVNVYIDCSKNEIFDEFVQTVSGSLGGSFTTTIQHIDINAMTERGYDESALNILMVKDLQSVQKHSMKTFLYGTTVIWSLHQNDLLNSTSALRLKISTQVIVLTNFYLYTVNNFVETKLSKLSLANVSHATTERFLGSFFSIKGLRGSNLTIFTEFNPPKSELTRIGNNYCMIGPDGVIVELLVKWLNIKPTFSSSIGIKHPSYPDWLNKSKLALRLHYQQYHTKVLTKNVVTIFNHK